MPPAGLGGGVSLLLIKIPRMNFFQRRRLLWRQAAEVSQTGSEALQELKRTGTVIEVVAIQQVFEHLLMLWPGRGLA